MPKPKANRKATVHTLPGGKGKRQGATAGIPIGKLLRNEGEIAVSLQRLGTMALTPQAAVRVVKGLKAVYHHCQAAQGERLKVLEEHCEKDADGKPVFEDEAKTEYKIPPDRAAACTEALVAIESRAVPFPQIRVSEFGKGSEVTPEFVARLDGIVVEG